MNTDIVPIMDTQELRRLSKYAAEKRKELKDLRNDFKDMGFLRRVWDSKVPDEDSNFFSLKESDPDSILEEIRRYEECYEEMSVIAEKVSSGELVNSNLRTELINLNNKLSKVHDLAEYGKRTCSSSAEYSLHDCFIKEYEKLKYIISDFQNVALCEMLTEAQMGWKEAREDIIVLQEQLSSVNDKYTDVCDKYNELQLNHKEVLNRQEIMLNDNRKMQQQLENLIDLITRNYPQSLA